MEMLRPIKFAIKELEQFLFIQRVVEIYKNPEIGKLKDHYELWIFAWSLVLVHLFVYSLINLLSDYFLFNPDKHFNLVKLTIVLIKNAVVFAILISLSSGIIFKGLGIRNINFYMGHIFLRVIYVFSVAFFLLSIGGIIEFNNIFKYGNYMPNFYQSLFLLILVLCWAFLIFRMLLIPIYKIASSQYKVVRMLSVVFILLFSVKINQYVSAAFPINFLNTQEIIQNISNCSIIKR